MKKFLLILAVTLPLNHISAEDNFFNTIAKWTMPALKFLTFASTVYILCDQSKQIQQSEQKIKRLTKKVLGHEEQIQKNQSLLKSNNDLIKTLTDENKNQRQAIEKLNVENKSLKQDFTMLNTAVQENKTSINTMNHRLDTFKRTIMENIQFKYLDIVKALHTGKRQLDAQTRQNTEILDLVNLTHSTMINHLQNELNKTQTAQNEFNQTIEKMVPELESKITQNLEEAFHKKYVDKIRQAHMSALEPVVDSRLTIIRKEINFKNQDFIVINDTQKKLDKRVTALEKKCNNLGKK